MKIPKKIYLIPLFLILILLIRMVSEIEPEKGEIGGKGDEGGQKVVKVIDGDTVDLTGPERLRLLGIDTPEKGELFYDSARSFLQHLTLGKAVNIQYSGQKKDSYGRLLGYLYLDTLMVNREMIRLGLANLYLFKDNLGDKGRIEALLLAQRDAIDNRRGIWSIKHDPEEFYIAHRGSYRFHRPSCRSIKNPLGKDIVRFSTREEACREGYSPCRNCRP
jgi:micrococcal nuclease